MVVLNIVTGDLVYLKDDDSVIATANWRTAAKQYFGYCKKTALNSATSRHSVEGARHPT